MWLLNRVNTFCLVMPRFGSVRFSDNFREVRTKTWTFGSVRKSRIWKFRQFGSLSAADPWCYNKVTGEQDGHMDLRRIASGVVPVMSQWNIILFRQTLLSCKSKHIFVCIFIITYTINIRWILLEFRKGSDTQHSTNRPDSSSETHHFARTVGHITTPLAILLKSMCPSCSPVTLL